MRALAQRTSGATKDIRKVLSDSGDRITLGRELASRARERMKDVLYAVDKVGAALEEITVASAEQRTGVTQLSTAVSQMDALTQQNAAMVEELAAAAETLNFRVTEVSSSKRLFRLDRGESTLSQLDAVSLRREGKQLMAPADG